MSESAAVSTPILVRTEDGFSPVFTSLHQSSPVFTSLHQSSPVCGLLLKLMLCRRNMTSTGVLLLI